MKVNCSEDRQPFATVLVGTFSTVFFAELGDKTQLVTLLFSAQSGEPWVVFFSASTALIITSLAVIILGQWLSKVFPTARMELMAGLLMIILGLGIGIQACSSLFLSTT